MSGVVRPVTGAFRGLDSSQFPQRFQCAARRTDRAASQRRSGT